MMDLALDTDLNSGVYWSKELEGRYFTPAPPNATTSLY